MLTLTCRTVCCQKVLKNSAVWFSRPIHVLCKDVNSNNKCNQPVWNVRAFTTEVKRTSLYDFHVEKKGKMVNFSGYSLPVLYGKESIHDSHQHTRSSCSIFDVSHMLQTSISGKDRVEFMESLVVADIVNLPENKSTLTVFTNKLGGIIDDLVVTKTPVGHLYAVSNAGCRDKVQQLLKKNAHQFHEKGKDVTVRFLEDRAILAVQGPATAKVLQPVVNDVDLSQLYFMSSTLGNVCGVEGCRITRCGYTGEDGFELSVPSSKARTIVERLLSSEVSLVKLAGLGARDSLRLEAGLCLYGNDINESTTPSEASLSWLIGKRRRVTADFPGANIILSQVRNKPDRLRVGLVSQGPSARSKSAILSSTGEVIGEVTSGCPSPTLGCNVAMGYIKQDLAKVGNTVFLEIRKQIMESQIVKMPFVPAKYYLPPK